MDFIRVTLIEKHVSGKKISELRKTPDHLLPIAGIKSIASKPTEEGIYFINFCDNYHPNGLDFTVGYAEASLPSGFVNEINK